MSQESLRKIAYGLLFVLLAGLTTGWLGGI